MRSKAKGSIEIERTGIERSNRRQTAGDDSTRAHTGQPSHDGCYFSGCSARARRGAGLEAAVAARPADQRRPYRRTETKVSIEIKGSNRRQTAGDDSTRPHTDQPSHDGCHFLSVGPALAAEPGLKPRAPHGPPTSGGPTGEPKQKSRSKSKVAAVVRRLATTQRVRTRASRLTTAATFLGVGPALAAGPGLKPRAPHGPPASGGPPSMSLKKFHAGSPVNSRKNFAEHLPAKSTMREKFGFRGEIEPRAGSRYRNTKMGKVISAWSVNNMSESCY